MSITGELRKWGYGFCGDTYDVVTAIADRIDAEHQKAIMMASIEFKIKSQRRQAMLSIYEPPEYYPWQDATVAKFCKLKEVARVPVFVWPIPTVDGFFIVEHQDGHCQRVQPYELTFLGSKELFDQYSWE